MTNDLNCLICLCVYSTALILYSRLYLKSVIEAGKCSNNLELYLIFLEQPQQGREVTFEELNLLLSENSILLVDVREHNDVEKFGEIPGAVNIPRK